MSGIKYPETLLTLQRGTIFTIILVKFETSLRLYRETMKYLLKIYSKQLMYGLPPQIYDKC